MYANKSDNSYAHSALSLKVTTANLYNFIEPPNAYYHSDQIYTHEQWKQKHSWISSFIGNQQADIIGFQEVFSPSALKTFTSTHGYPYFSVVDKPEPINHYTFKKPVLCLASRYPICQARPLQAEAAISSLLGLESDFNYARAPLHATIDIPSLGLTDVYVVHLKSHRPMLDEIVRPSTLHDMIIKESTGGFRSTIQRGAEATQLMSAIIKRRFESNNPVILLGDFNDDLYVDTLSAFNLSKLRSTMHYLTDLPISHYQLQDSWQLFNKKNLSDDKRPFTHYYQQKGSTLDYILLSNEFDTGDINSIAEITEFHCNDKHLFAQEYQGIECSDHAIISITVALRS